MKNSKIVVVVPSNYKIVAASKRSGETFTLKSAGHSYQFSSFNLNGNELTGILDENLPAGEYTVEAHIVGEYSSSVATSHGLVQYEDSNGNC